MPDVKKDILLRPKIDTSTLAKMESQFSDVFSVIDKNLITELKKYKAAQAEIDKYKDALKAISELEGDNWDAERKRLQDKIEALKDYKNIDTGKTKKEDSDFVKDLKSIGKQFISSMTTAIKDAWKEAIDMIDYSQLSSSSTRDLMFSYGFSGSEAYGYEQALSLVGLDSMEDLMYANEQERQQFYDAFTKYTERYNTLADSGFFEDLQDVQYEWQDLQQEIQIEIIQFFANNKELIIDAMRTGIQLAEWLVTAISKLLAFFNTSALSSSYKSTATSDIIRNYSTNKSNQVNVTVDNTFNGVGTKDQSMLTNAGQMVWGQIIESVKQI